LPILIKKRYFLIQPQNPELQTNIVLYKDGEVVEELNTLEGDGM
jgi:hypothetical protein